jgi:ABC-2 type transport system ATP-binding protein
MGKSIFLSSHILSEVERLCDRVGIIREGVLVETGTLAELRHLTRNTMHVETERPVDGFDLFKGVHDLHKSENRLSFTVDSDELGAVVAHLSSFGITKLDSAPPTLESLFMLHYSAEGA